MNDSAVDFLVHDALGMILRCGRCPQSMVALQAGAGESVIEGSGNDITDYVWMGEVLKRPKSAVQLSGSTLSMVPVGAVIRIGDTEYAATEPTVELSFFEPGRYTVEVIKWPYLPAVFEVVK